MIIKENVSWINYYNDTFDGMDSNKTGKWMIFFDIQDPESYEYIQEICKDIIEKNILEVVKHTNLISAEIQNLNQGVAVFYLEYDDIDSHKKIITYLLEKEMIPKTKSGRYYKNSFKLDSQTRNKEYGDTFTGKITLDQFIDLETGEWIYK
ncbi:hypothetical protein [Vagococcus fluvialis]|uniref:hypothetical protein n=1 Tax=Vagococcus fluvialis TaxID=2738 RepID=UPI0022E697D8|nr:hypothetical protein [Vagococcus fluvialis]